MAKVISSNTKSLYNNKKCWYCQEKPPVKDELMCKDCGNLKKRKIGTTMTGNTEYKYNF